GGGRLLRLERRHDDRLRLRGARRDGERRLPPPLAGRRGGERMTAGIDGDGRLPRGARDVVGVDREMQPGYVGAGREGDRRARQLRFERRDVVARELLSIGAAVTPREPER